MNSLVLISLFCVPSMATRTVAGPASNTDPGGKVGERPYEMAWADRKPAHPEGLNETLLLIFERPDKLKQALEWRVQKAIEWADEFIKLGVDCVWIGEGAASSSIISPEMYSEFVLPYASRVVEHLKSSGIVTIMHVCGDINQSIGAIAKTGVDAMDIDYMVDLKAARKAIERPICLRGNLNPVDLLNMPCDILIEHCKRIIDSGGFPFVLSTGCLVARDTPKENIDAMVAASITK